MVRRSQPRGLGPPPILSPQAFPRGSRVGLGVKEGRSVITYRAFGGYRFVRMVRAIQGYKGFEEGLDQAFGGRDSTESLVLFWGCVISAPVRVSSYGTAHRQHANSTKPKTSITQAQDPFGEMKDE